MTTQWSSLGDIGVVTSAADIAKASQENLDSGLPSSMRLRAALGIAMERYYSP